MDNSHLKQAESIFDYIELITEKPLDERHKDFIYGTLRLTYGDGYLKALRVIQGEEA